MIAERGYVGAREAGLRLLVAAALPWTILAFGALLRLFWYFDRGSLWLDEAFLSLNIVHRSPTELLEKLDFNQGAPWGFLLAEKLSVATLGADELSLRLVPLLAALASLPVFWRVASFYLKGGALLLSLMLFSLAPQLVRYSAEVKQYSLDVLASLLGLWLLHSARQLSDWRRAAAVGLGGAILVWFSHASMFVLGAGGVVLGAAALVRRDWWHLRRLALVGAAWASSAGAFFLLAWPKLRELQGSLAGTEEYTVPFPPESLGDLSDVVRRAGDVLEGAFGILGRPWSILIIVAAASLALAGGLALARRDRLRTALLVAPLFAAAAAIATGRYPFSIRTVLFLVPFVVVLVAAGTQAALEATAERRQEGRSIAAAAMIAAAWLIAVAGIASFRVIARQPEQDVKPVLVDLRAAWRPGDVLYLHTESQYAVRFYAEEDGLNRSKAGEVLWRVVPTSGTTGGAAALRSAPPALVVERREPRWTFLRDLAALDGRKRIWFVFSHVVKFEGRAAVNPRDRYIATLDAAGTRRMTIRHGDAMALLYDLRR